MMYERWLCRLSYLAACFIILSLTGVSLAEPIVDGPIAREKLKRDVADLLYQGKYGELENLSKRLRTSKARFPEGHWQLQYFYDAVEVPPKGNVVQPMPKSKWDRHFALLAKWQKAFPRSVTAQVATAKAWLAYGWEARGGGFSSAVAEEGWQLLGERMTQAVEQLNMPPSGPLQDCPERFNTLLLIGKVQGWPREKFMALFRAAVAFEPRYYSFYAAALDYATPRWSGKDTEWLEMVNKVDSLSGEPGNRELYTRMVQGWFGQEWTNFDDNGVSWKTMKQGFLDMEKKFPHSPYNLNNFAKYACIAGDMETARVLLKKIGKSPYLKCWQEPSKVFDECIKAAGVGGPSRAEIKESQESIQTRVLAEQGDKYSQYKVAMEQLPHDASGKDWENSKGTELLKALAVKGFAPAQAELGRRYLNNQRDSADKSMALQWMERAALQGDDARYLLPQLYEAPPLANLIKAYAWYEFNDDETGRKRIKEMSKVLSAEQLEESKKEIQNLRKTAEVVADDGLKVQNLQFRIPEPL